MPRLIAQEEHSLVPPRQEQAMLPGEMSCTNSFFQIWLQKISSTDMISVVNANCWLAEPSANLRQLKMYLSEQLISINFYR